MTWTYFFIWFGFWFLCQNGMDLICQLLFFGTVCFLCARTYFFGVKLTSPPAWHSPLSCFHFIWFVCEDDMNLICQLLFFGTLFFFVRE